MIARTPKSRPSLNGMFGQAVSPPGTVKPAPSTPAHSRETLVKKTPTTARIVSTSSIALREQIAKAKASRKSEVVDEPEQSPKTSSSNVLREQIAKAREAARRAKIEVTRTSTPPRDAFLPDPTEIATFDFGLGDPFNQQAKGNKSVLQRRIDGARTDGRLNIAAMDLKEIPDNVLDMYKYDPNDTTVAWGEIVDLTSIIAADNELETLPEAMFPDVDFETMIDSDEGGPQFGAVQTIDLHGNSLRELPIGLTRLTQLSRLNLVSVTTLVERLCESLPMHRLRLHDSTFADHVQSRNKLQMDIFDIITGISSLRELRLADNELQGDVPASISSLAALEVVELQGNKLTSLPIEVRELTCLRVLNISSNQLSSVPMDLFQTGLIELIASKNRFEGAFFTCSSAPNLQELNISNNSLKSLCDAESIDLPALKTLNVSTNRLTSLPSMENWIKLQTLIVGENKLAVFPEGFTTLTELRVADFTANNITQLDERIALMSLRTLILAANPLRERKFLTMSFEDMKRNLASRLPTTEALAADEDEYEFPTEDAAPEAQGWKVTPSGTLDLSSKSLDTIDETALAAVADNMRQLHLQQNTFTCIPAALSQVTFLTVLDLSRNNIETSLTSPLSLLKLKDLRLAANKLSSLDALIAHLAAPALQTLDVSNNRLTGTLPCLHTAFPSLISLLAADNSLSVAPASSLEGLKIVNLANNDIERLDPLISRFQGTLTSLNVEGNKFRVPSWHMLQKGTESVLGWLRERVPVEVPVEVLVDLEDEVATKETNVIRESWKSNSTVFWNADDSGVD
jgi:Leucine-rich repeat (LRR) protein